MDLARLINAVKRFPKKKVAVVGDFILDRYQVGFIDRLNPEDHSSTLFNVMRHDDRLGGAANVAANVSSLGATTTLYTQLCRDHYLREMESLCTANNLHLERVLGGKTIVKFRPLQEQPKKQLMRLDYDHFGGSSPQPMSPRRESRLSARIFQTEPDTIIFSDYNKSVLRGGLSPAIIEWANTNGIVTIVDPKPDNIDKFHGATAICPNLDEARKITGEQDPERAARCLREQYDVQNIFITQGREGILIYNGGFSVVPTKARSVTDSTGAGDTVAAALGLALASGLNPVESATLANYAAGIAVEHSGTYRVSKKELLQRLRENL